MKRLHSYFFKPFLRFFWELKTKKIKAIPWVELGIVISPIFAQYGLPLGNVGMVLIFLIAGAVFLWKRTLVSFFPLVFLVSYVVTVGVIKLVFTPNVSEVFHTIMASVLLFLSVSAILPNIRLSRLLKVLVVLGVFTSFGVYFHAILVYGFHQMVKPIPLFPGVFDSYTQMRLNEFLARPKGFFFEPASYASFVLPAFFSSLRLRRWVESGFLLIGVFLSASVYGIVVAISALFLFLLLKGRQTKKPAVFYSIVVGTLITSATLFFTMPFFEIAKTKLLNELSGVGSFIPRVLAGFPITFSLNPQELLFGTKYSALIYLQDSNTNLVPPEAYYTYGYANSLAQSFVYYGVFGFLLLGFLLFFLCRGLSQKNLPWICMLVADLIATSAFLNFSFWYSILLLGALLFYDSDRRGFFVVSFIPWSVESKDLSKIPFNTYRI